MAPSRFPLPRTGPLRELGCPARSVRRSVSSAATLARSTRRRYRPCLNATADAESLAAPAALPRFVHYDTDATRRRRRWFCLVAIAPVRRSGGRAPLPRFVHYDTDATRRRRCCFCLEATALLWTRRSSRRSRESSDTGTAVLRRRSIWGSAAR